MRRRNRSYKPRTTNKQSRDFSFKPFAFLAFTFVLLLLAQLFSLSIVGTKGAELATITEEKKQAEENIRKLEADISEVQSLERIEYIAKEKLGMQEPKEIKYLTGSTVVSQK